MKLDNKNILLMKLDNNINHILMIDKTNYMSTQQFNWILEDLETKKVPYAAVQYIKDYFTSEQLVILLKQVPETLEYFI